MKITMVKDPKVVDAAERYLAHAQERKDGFDDYHQHCYPHLVALLKARGGQDADVEDAIQEAMASMVQERKLKFINNVERFICDTMLRAKRALANIRRKQANETKKLQNFKEVGSKVEDEVILESSEKHLHLNQRWIEMTHTEYKRMLVGIFCKKTRYPIKRMKLKDIAILLNVDPSYITKIYRNEVKAPLDQLGNRFESQWENDDV